MVYVQYMLWVQPVDATLYSYQKDGVLIMKQRTRIYYTEEQKSLMWERWKKGDSIHSIGRLFDRGHSSIQRILSEAGEKPPVKRTRSRLASAH